jgi:hypothetical protein
VTIDFETFQSALDAPGDGRPPAMDEIIGAGRKLRLKRRLAAVSISAVALVAVAGATVAAWPAQAPPSPAAAAAWPTTPYVAYDVAGSWGKAVETGLTQHGRSVVVTAFHNANPAYPDITFGVRTCTVTATHQPAVCANTFDDKGPDRKPGFHAIELPTSTGKVNLPMYGYYVGPAVTITVKSRGKTVQAQTATWSEDKNVVLFWFSPKDVYLKVDKSSPLYKENKVTPGEQPDATDWTAYDAAGKTLPVGTPFVIG